ncbi:uncharacterized protein Pyn_30041 [Prunus yedoensis var. nudiflora]|uniref:PB1-like domain-containing protein n=1 Tax=Prunus yedoensis var. nudiflora TaxID=2094558 RepID=A0A314ZMN0_PRUYE|nr:uncharacterized protein Pyn_30041 [Prunus yedoensis var. nudiflora]
MYHNGEIRGNYHVNGSVDWFNYCDKDRMSMTEIDAMVKELRYESMINYWYNIPGDHFDGGLVELSEDADVLDMLVFVPDTRLINIFLEHVFACSQGQFYSQVASNIFINLDKQGLNQVELNEQGLNQIGLTDQASKQGKETATVNNEENSAKGQEKANGCSNKGKGKDKATDEMSAMVKHAFGIKKKCGILRRTKTIHQKDKEGVEGRVEGVRTKSKRHSMTLRSGRRYANATDFEDEDDDSANSEDSEYMISKNFSEYEDDGFLEEWVDDQTEWTGVKQTGNEAAVDWLIDVELDYEDSECKDYSKYKFDDEADKNWPQFSAATDMADPKFKIGMLFTNCKVFRAAVREYSILQKCGFEAEGSLWGPKLWVDDICFKNAT